MIASGGTFGQNSLAVDAQGHVYLAMGILETSEWDSRRAVAVLSNASGSWLIEQVTRFSAYDTPALAIDTDGSLWMAFSESSLGDCTGCETGPVFVTTNRSGRWTDPLVAGDGLFGDPSIVAAHGAAHLVYQFVGYDCWIGEEDEAEPGPDCGAHYATNSSGEWTRRQLDDLSLRYSDPHIALGPTGRPSVTFHQQGGTVLAELQDDAEFSFDPISGSVGPSRLAIGPGGDPAILASASDGVVTGRRLFHRLDGAWTNLPVEIGQDYVSFTRDASGEPQFLAWYDHDGPRGLWHFQGWEPGGLATQLTTDDVGTAVIASGPDGRLHVVYGNADGIWYMTNSPGPVGLPGS
jgi:hypothetical protein